MTDLKLYTLLEEFCSEVHKDDGICFVNRYNYDDFVSQLEINDCEEGFDAYVTTNGDLCFKLDDICHMADDFDSLKEMVIEKLGQ